MDKQIKKVTPLPVDEAEQNAKQQLAKKLGSETVADDANVPEEKAQVIRAIEHIVRETLAIFGMNYDEMIAMDGKSLYSRVVAKRPDVLNTVMQEESPVLSALKIAVGFKPYAAFIEKYGDEPEAIKKAIREEVMAEMSTQRSAKEKQASVKTEMPSFNSGVKPSTKPKQKTPSTLEDIFKR